MQEKIDRLLLCILVICVLGVIGIIEKDKLLYHTKGEHIVIQLDEQVSAIEIPEIPEKTEESETENTEKVDINTASKEQLMTLKGIGDKLSDNIIAYRSIQKFENIEDIKNVDGIGDKKFEDIAENICVE